MTTHLYQPNTIIQGDCLDVLSNLPESSVQCVITSPPYYRLRDYDVEGQIGLEASPETFIDTLVQVFHEVRRVLRKDGTLWCNLGDSYVGSGKGYGSDHGKHAIEFLPGPTPAINGLKPKDLMMIPARVALALQADGWWLRQTIIWHKPTAMPESVTDRPTTAHEYIFLLAKSEQYYYDADAIREPLKPKTFTTFGTKHRPQGNDLLGQVKSDNWGRTVPERQPKLSADGEIAGANKRSVWTVASRPFSGAHFATFPPKLIEPCVLAGSSPYACEQCRSPWKRVIVPTGHSNHRETAHVPHNTPTKVDSTGWAPLHRATDQWQPTCPCPDNTGSGSCMILDPFMGAGTVALVALQHGRNYLGIELNPKYIDIAERRIAHVQQSLWSTSPFVVETLDDFEEKNNGK